MSKTSGGKSGFMWATGISFCAAMVAMAFSIDCSRSGVPGLQANPPPRGVSIVLLVLLSKCARVIGVEIVVLFHGVSKVSTGSIRAAPLGK